ncbi:hypothetical protein AAF712_015265 [Marasmius tenuissimus]|uniref:EthD domain-containing protein n=1 Tax=Marasmius tenuissimus TaxID=585030 RepID=A0ABR2ZAP4_9AGAR|nr:hypothetical protein PM082_019610 [Marasmius tenuissimus]
MRSLLFFCFALVTLVNVRAVFPRADPGDADDFVSNRTRMLIYFQRNPNLTFSEMSDYWRVKHAPLFLSTKGVRQNILRYVQLHVNQEWKQRLSKEGFSVPDWDGVMIAEAKSIDNILTAFNNKEYNETVLPDTAKYTNTNTGLTGFVKITTVINKLPDENSLPDSKLGVIRKDVQTLVGDFNSKPGMKYPDFVKYWTKVNTPKLVSVIKSSGEDKEVLDYELNTLDPTKPTIGNPFPSFTDKWDAVAMLSSRNIGDVEDILKNSKAAQFIRKDAPNFVDVKKGIDFIPCDVVSYKIPPP